MRNSPFFKGLFFEANPIPVKAAMHMMGMISDEIRLPLTPMSDGPKARLRQMLKDAELI